MRSRRAEPRESSESALSTAVRACSAKRHSDAGGRKALRPSIWRSHAAGMTGLRDNRARCADDTARLHFAGVEPPAAGGSADAIHQPQEFLSPYPCALLHSRSTIHAVACWALGVKHLRTRGYHPQTNGKAERSLAPCSPTGPTARSTATAANEQQPLTAGSGTTTISANTQPSATTHPSPG